MPINLGLVRIQRLLSVLGNPHIHSNFKAIHIAGTNGKGSICSYLSHILSANNISNGRFTSPHLLTRNDSIQINNKPVNSLKFETVESEIIKTDKEHGIGCTEFEILTCVAFQIFKEERVDVAVFEVGLGGRDDSTNVLTADKLLCCGVSKVGLDHENLLGSTLSEIAFQKVGIFKEKVPSVIDGSNDDAVLSVANSEASELHVQLYKASNKPDTKFKFGELNEFQPSLKGKYQTMNVSVALKLTELIQERCFPNIRKELIQKGISSTQWPGRLQSLDLHIENGNHFPILLDGAHNTQASIELGKYLDEFYRNQDEPLVFVIGVTKGKNINDLFKGIIKPQDTVILTQIAGEIDGMPWIKPADPNELAEKVMEITKDVRPIISLRDALLQAYNEYVEGNKKVVICGSLYLASDVLRINNRNI